MNARQKAKYYKHKWQSLENALRKINNVREIPITEVPLKRVPLAIMIRNPYFHYWDSANLEDKENIRDLMDREAKCKFADAIFEELQNNETIKKYEFGDATEYRVTFYIECVRSESV